MCVEGGVVEAEAVASARFGATQRGARLVQQLRLLRIGVEHAYAEDFASGFAMERKEIFDLIGTPNQVESVTAFFEKRTPNYIEVEVGQ